MASLEKTVEGLIKEIQSSEKLKSQAVLLGCWDHPNIQDQYVRLCWKELEHNMPAGQYPVEPTQLLNGQWPSELLTEMEVTDSELVQSLDQLNQEMPHSPPTCSIAAASWPKEEPSKIQLEVTDSELIQALDHAMETSHNQVNQDIR